MLRILPTWVVTVRTAMINSSAISRSVLPAATNRRTSTSRWVRPSGRREEPVRRFEPKAPLHAHVEAACLALWRFEGLLVAALLRAIGLHCRTCRARLRQIPNNSKHIPGGSLLYYKTPTHLRNGGPILLRPQLRGLADPTTGQSRRGSSIGQKVEPGRRRCVGRFPRLP